MRAFNPILMTLCLASMAVAVVAVMTGWIATAHACSGASIIFAAACDNRI
ncbi:MAG: hypothetical protein QM754_18475 [Tepidisphaeraceae bacterium]